MNCPKCGKDDIDWRTVPRYNSEAELVGVGWYHGCGHIMERVI